MLAEIVRYLRCPVCAGTVELTPPVLRCERGHSFDLARQGYLNLLTGRPRVGADTAEMVAARADLLAAGHFRFLAKALASLSVRQDPPGAGLVVEVGAGTGYYLAAVLDRLPTRTGLALDVSIPAVRRAARAHPRAGAVVADAWRGLPLADDSAAVLLNVFAPRNGAEFRRVLRDDGVLLVVTPRRGHLAELVGPLGLLEVDPDKDRRLAASLGPFFTLVEEAGYGHPLSLSRADAGRLVGMGPNAWHTDAARLTEHLARLTEPVPATASVTLRTYRPRKDPPSSG
jgi:23S rRNA (guanine745-N1)-methyltransferase